MEGGLFLIFIIIALVARAIEAMTKGGKGKQPPPSPQRRPRPEYERSHGPTRLPDRAGQLPSPMSGPRDGVPRDANEDAAAEMIPDELWEILTGRPKPRRQPVPQHTPEPMWDEEADRSEAESATIRTALPDEEAEYEVRRRAEEAERQRERRELRERRQRGRDANLASKAPGVVSLEGPVPTAAARHTAFHDKLDATAQVPRRGGARQPSRAWLFGEDDMKRAIVLQEVLGPPKGLE